MIDLRGLEVVHKTFGNGIVSTNDDEYITVRFSNQEKTFVYPDIFAKILYLPDNEDINKIIKSDLNAKNKKEQVEKEERQRDIQDAANGIVMASSKNLVQEVNNSKPEESSDEL